MLKQKRLNISNWCTHSDLMDSPYQSNYYIHSAFDTMAVYDYRFRWKDKNKEVMRICINRYKTKSKNGNYYYQLWGYSYKTGVTSVPKKLSLSAVKDVNWIKYYFGEIIKELC